MKYAEIPFVDKKVSRIIFGTAFEPINQGKDGTELFKAAWKAGINTFDTARVYGGAERSLGSWLARFGNRDQAVIISKCGHPSLLDKKRMNEKEMRKDLQKSLEELQTDYIDIYLLHRDNPETDAGVAVEVFNSLYAEGKIRAFGGSNWTHERIEEASEYAYKHNLIPFSVSSPNFGIARQVCDLWGGGCVTISGPEHADARAWYRKNQMPVIAYSSLARGLFSGKLKSTEKDRMKEVLDSYAVKGYGSGDNFERLRRAEILARKYGCSVAQIAVSWLFSEGINAFAVCSMGKPERMKQNADALELALGREEADWLAMEGK